jgi:hypothetical protein
MRNRTCLCLAALSAAWLAGCGTSAPTVGMTRPMGDVQYDAAFVAAQQVLGQYDFTVDSADATRGVIVSRPRDVQERQLIRNVPGREIATLTLTRGEGRVIARLSIAVQRQATGAQRNTQMTVNSYDSVPNQTPSDAGGATTPEQNASWTTERYDTLQEEKILDDLFEAL